MKKLIFLICALVVTIGVQAQSKTESKPNNDIYTFTTVKDIPTTAVRNQSRSGTCWCHSAIAFLESELIRTGKGECDLAEMFVVRKNFEDKAEKYVREQGKGLCIAQNA